jgi:hypothetical protein
MAKSRWIDLGPLLLRRLPLYAAALFLTSAALLQFDLIPLYMAWLLVALGLLLLASGA